MLSVVIEAAGGYICIFSIYTGKGPGVLLRGHVTVDQDCSKNTKCFMGLQCKVCLLDTCGHIYFDNYYSSADIIQRKKNYRQMYACCTVKGHRKNLPEAVLKS